MTWTRRVGLVGTSAFLVACGAASGGSAGPPESPKELAERVGCESSYSDATTEEIGVEAVGTCEVGGKQVRLLTFANDDARDNFKEIAASFGGRYVEGSGYLVEAPDAKTEKRVEDALG